MQPNVASPLSSPQRPAPSPPTPTRSGLIAGGCGLPGLRLRLALLQPLDVVAQLESRSQLQAHVLHDHVAPQQHQGFTIDLLQRTERREGHVGGNGPLGGETETPVYVQRLFLATRSVRELTATLLGQSTLQSNL